MGLDDIINAQDYYDQDLITKGDILASKYDYGQGKLFTGLTVSTIAASTSILTGSLANRLYDGIMSNLPVYSNILSNAIIPWAALGLGLGYGNTDTNNQKIIPGLALGGLLLYSLEQTISSLGIPIYYLATGAGITSGLTMSVIASAVAPIAALFGVGWTASMLYRHFIKGRRARKERKKKKS